MVCGCFVQRVYDFKEPLSIQRNVYNNNIVYVVRTYTMHTVAEIDIDPNASRRGCKKSLLRKHYSSYDKIQYTWNYDVSLS